MIEKLNKLIYDDQVINICCNKLKVNKYKLMDNIHDVYVRLVNMILNGKNVDINKGYLISCICRDYINSIEDLVSLNFDQEDTYTYDINKDILHYVISTGEQSSLEIYLIRVRLYKIETQSDSSKKLNLTINQLQYKQKGILSKLKIKIENFSI